MVSVLRGSGLGEVTLDVHELLTAQAASPGDLVLSERPPPQGVWGTSSPPSGLPFAWSCPADTSRSCHLSFEEQETMSLLLGEGRLFYGMLREQALLCRHVERVSAALPGRTMSETMSLLNTDSCHRILEQSQTILRLRAADGHTYTLSRRQ
jgi:hypothetical protein